MSLKQTITLLFMALVIVGCSTTDTKDQPKSPAAYKEPQVKITHASPTEVIADVPSLEATAVATEQAIDTAQNQENEVLDEAAEEAIDQSLMDEIDALLNQIETDLERMDTNP